MVFSKIKRVLIANRGEIACRVIRTCKEHGLFSIAVYSKEDLDSLHVQEADTAVLLPGVGAAAYINIEQVVKVAKDTNADVVVPGYGFLSENSEFAAALAENGIIFAGPSSESVEKFGLKHLAREISKSCEVPVVPGTDLISDKSVLIESCSEIGYPVILKATAGGGGMGLKVCYSEAEAIEGFDQVVSRGTSLFSNAGVFVEKYIQSGRHIEVQLFGNGLGDIVTFGERECSIQRRHQKVIEEAPSPFVVANNGLRKELTSCAKRLAESISYKSAGTIEFLVDDETGKFYFLEMNTRLQVEHGITELVYNVDLVYFMLLQADYELNGSGIPVEILNQSLNYDSDGVEVPHGSAIEVRVYAENPVKDFAPSPGILHNVEFPIIENVRVDHWVSTGCKVSPYFDPLLAKVMAWTPERTSEKIIEVLEKTKIQGPINNIEYCISILKSAEFRRGYTLTSFLGSFVFEPHLIEFVESGSYTTVQDLKGRRKVRHGVPHSGPVDDLSLQIANIIVGNDKSTEGLECVMKGPTLKFHQSAVIALTGGTFEFFIDGEPVEMFREVLVPRGATVEIGEATGRASKCYLAIKGGLPGVSNYLGSKSCTPSLSLGGHQGRTFLPGDCLEFVGSDECSNYVFPSELIPEYNPDTTVVRMISGPHDTPDIVSKEGNEKLYSDTYSVNFNSNRGAMRLDGPSLICSRSHGGDGGGHPTNILEYPYPLCGLSAVGSTMVLFGVDGATLSGFICVSVPTEVDFWKFGQAAINSPIKFELITYDDALLLKKKRDEFIEYISTKPASGDRKFDDQLSKYEKAVAGEFLFQEDATDDHPYVAFRQGGERMILIDFGTTEFNLFHNGRQYVLKGEIEKKLSSKVENIELSSGAMCVTFDPFAVDRASLLDELVALERGLPPIETLKVPSRTFRLPLCFDHNALDHCIKRYMSSQRSHAPYLPSNMEYLMKANCIETVDDFKKSVINQPQIVVAVSFLCANPLLVLRDPRCRMKTSKYNPARTTTPSGAVGSGSVSQSVYPLESPGGYMIWGMTLPNWYWDTFGRCHDQPWPLTEFDQVIYYEVDEAELERLNSLHLTKKLKFEPEVSEFDFVSYKKFVDEIDVEYKELLSRKEKAFAELLQAEEDDIALWEEEKAAAKASKLDGADLLSDPDALAVVSTMPSNVFKINVAKGEIISKTQVLVILEAMKMEIPMRVTDKKSADDAKFEVMEIIVEEGDVVNPGDTLLIVKRQ